MIATTRVPAPSCQCQEPSLFRYPNNGLFHIMAFHTAKTIRIYPHNGSPNIFQYTNSYIIPNHHRPRNKKGSPSKAINKYQPAIMKKSFQASDSPDVPLNMSFNQRIAHTPTIRPTMYIQSLNIKECRSFVTSVTKPVLTGRNRSIYFIFRRIIRTFQVLKHYDYTT